MGVIQFSGCVNWMSHCHLSCLSFLLLSFPFGNCASEELEQFEHAVVSQGAFSIYQWTATGCSAGLTFAGGTLPQ